MANKAVGTLPENVMEHDGMLWKPNRGATTTANEFITARSLFLELNEDSRWNPWVREDRSADISAALEIMDQWQRAEPGHRMLTTQEFEAKMAKRERERKQQRAERDAEREARKPQYDPERAHARLAVLEHQSVVEHELAEVASYRDGSRFPLMDPQRRQEKITELDASIEHRRTEIQRLAAVVGDPEDVIGEGGWLPQERRERMLEYYSYERQTEVRKLRKEVSALNTKIEATTDKQKRRELKSQLATVARRLDALLAVPPLTPDDMCSDCPTPIAQHGWVTPLATPRC
jgi:DNA repair exonuclease SbcCD ATPase subunit